MDGTQHARDEAMGLQAGLRARPLPAPAVGDPLDAALAAAAAEILTVHPNQEIYGIGEPARLLYRVASGAVRSCHGTRDGRRQVSEFLLPGDVFGFTAGDRHSCAAEAICRTTVLTYPWARLREAALHRPSVSRALCRSASATVLRGRAQLVLLGRQSAAERLASFLLDMVERLPSRRDGSFDLPMSRADIADHLGLTVETVCRVLAEMRRTGLIDMREAQRISLRDRARLEEMSDRRAGPAYDLRRN